MRRRRATSETATRALRVGRGYLRLKAGSFAENRAQSGLAHRLLHCRNRAPRRVRKQVDTIEENTMEIGYFTMPSHPPECGLKEGQDWDLHVLRWLD